MGTLHLQVKKGIETCPLQLGATAEPQQSRVADPSPPASGTKSGMLFKTFFFTRPNAVTVEDSRLIRITVGLKPSASRRCRGLAEPPHPSASRRWRGLAEAFQDCEPGSFDGLVLLLALLLLWPWLFQSRVVESQVVELLNCSIQI